MAFQIFCGVPDKTKNEYIKFLGENYNVLDVLNAYQSDTYRLSGLSSILASPPKTSPSLAEVVSTFKDNSKKLEVLSSCLSKYQVTESDFELIVKSFSSERNQMKAIKAMRTKLTNLSIDVPRLMTQFTTDERRMKIIKYFSEKISSESFCRIIEMINDRNNVYTLSSKYVLAKWRFYSNDQIITILKKIGPNNIELFEKLIALKYPFDSSCFLEIADIYKGGSFQNAAASLLIGLTQDTKIVDQLKQNLQQLPHDTISNQITNDDEDESEDEEEDSHHVDTQSLLLKYFPDPSILSGKAVIQLGKRKYTYINGVSTDSGVKGLPSEEQANIAAQRESLKTNAKRICKRCSNSNFSYMLMPCNHVCLCSLCVREVCKQSTKQCPVCTSKITKVSKVYTY